MITVTTDWERGRKEENNKNRKRERKLCPCVPTPSGGRASRWALRWSPVPPPHRPAQHYLFDKYGEIRMSVHVTMRINKYKQKQKKKKKHRVWKEGGMEERQGGQSERRRGQGLRGLWRSNNLSSFPDLSRHISIKVVFKLGPWIRYAIGGDACLDGWASRIFHRHSWRMKIMKILSRL